MKSKHYYSIEATSIGFLRRLVLTMLAVTVLALLTQPACAGQVSAAKGASAMVTAAKQPLEIVVQPAGGDRYVGDSHVFEVVAYGGIPPYHYVWLKDHAPVGGPDAPFWTLNDLSVDDTADYSCIVTDSGTGNVFSEDAHLTVAEHISITKQPVGGVAYIGGSFTFKVGASGGIGALHYQWWFGGQVPVVPVGLDSDTLELFGLYPHQSGPYFCVVTDEGSDEVTSEEAILTVYDPMYFEFQPTGGQWSTGELVTLEVGVSGGSGQYAYQWFKDANSNRTMDPGEELINGGNIFGADEYMLFMDPVTPADSGDYACVVSDLGAPGPPITSEPAMVTVWDHLTIVVQPSDGYFYLGVPASLRVVAGGGSGVYAYQWWKFAGPIPGADTDTLSFPFPDLDDMDWYYCIVTDEGGGSDPPLWSNNVWVQVTDPVVIESNPDDGQIYEGLPFQFSVLASGGYPPLSYTWFLDANVNSEMDPGEELTNGDRIFGADTPVLMIDPVEEGDTGMYGCYVEDSHGGNATSALADLWVLDMISTPQSPTNADELEFTVSFFLPMFNFDEEYDVVINDYGPVAGSPGFVTMIDPMHYIVSRVGIIGDGFFTLSIRTLDQGGDVYDVFGDPLEWSDTTTVHIDNTPPIINPIFTETPSSPGYPTNVDQLAFSVSFNENMRGFDEPDDVRIEYLNAPGDNLVCRSVTIVPLDEANYEVILGEFTGDGAFKVVFDPFSKNGDGVTDQAGNPPDSGEESEWSYVDKIPPEVLIGVLSSYTTSGEDITFTLTYTDLHFDESTILPGPALEGYITLVPGPASTASGTAHIIGGSGNERVVQLTDFTGHGTLNIVVMGGTAEDTAGNPAGSAEGDMPIHVSVGVPIAWWPVAIALLAAALVVVRRRTART